MSSDFNSEQEIKVIIREYERQLETESITFMPIEYFEQIVDYYLDRNKPAEALKACNIGIDQHPFSTELKLDKAQIHRH